VEPNEEESLKPLTPRSYCDEDANRKRPDVAAQQKQKEKKQQ
jgi:hypothetical protein